MQTLPMDDTTIQNPNMDNYDIDDKIQNIPVIL